MFIVDVGIMAVVSINEHNLALKVIKVVGSCRTLKQLRNAHVYWKRAQRRVPNYNYLIERQYVKTIERILQGEADDKRTLH